MRKKKVFIQSDCSLAKTGFGRNMKAILTYLYKTGKYDLVAYCCGVQASNPVLSKTPWKSIGSLPDSQQELEAIQKDPNISRNAGYGSYMIDKVILEEKPDIYIGVQDFWGVDFAMEKRWWNKIPCAIWTTLDSLPLLPAAVEKASRIKNYWVWSNFAEKELHRLGHTHVKTLHGALEDSSFFRLPNKKRAELRAINGIPQDSFIVGFVFRNQLRKSVPNLLEGFALFKKNNPQIKNAKLLLHTSYSEGWNIQRLSKEYGVSNDDVLTTHVCSNCRRYWVRPFTEENQNCPCCGAEKSISTTNTGKGVLESQLNEVYNLMDVYCHPFTSGGQELPVQEAKLTELITLVTNYSCGEELCEEGSGSLPLDWAEYREHQTEFRKASTYPSSIAKQLERVFKMDAAKRSEMGTKAREWVLRNFSVETVGKQLEAFLDSCEVTNYDFSTPEPLKDPKANIPQIDDDEQWITALYKNILLMDVDKNDEGHKYWMTELSKKMPRDQIEDFFRQTATNENNKRQSQIEFCELLDKDDEGRRILFVIPESIGDIFLCTSLFESLKQLYPDYNLYVATKPEYFDLMDGNSNVHKVIPYTPQMDNHFWLTGIGKHKGFFEVAFHPYFGTQRIIDYVNNGKDKIAFSLK